MKKRGIPGICLIGCISFLLVTGEAVFAQATPVQVDPAPQVNAPFPVLSQAQLEGLVSPIALYPDPLLSQVLVASTYPLEIVEAAQWLRQNSSLTGAAAQSAAANQNWDPSVQALVVFPDVLFRMSDHIQWTTDLGNAFLAQQSAIMDAVQQLRSQAMASGKLASNVETTVTTESQGDASVVQILPANPEVIYIPSYDPSLIWGPAFYPYPAMPYDPFFYGAGFIGYSSCIFVGPLFAGWHGWGGWGWRPNWFGRSVLVNNSFFSRYGYNRYGPVRSSGVGATAWVHDPGHRGNVPYTNPTVAAQFNNGYRGGGAGRPQMAMRSPMSAGATNFAHPGGSTYSTPRPPLGNTYRSVPSTPYTAPRSYTAPQSYAAPRGNFTASRPAPSMGYRSAPAPSFRSAPSFGGGRSFGGGGRSGGGGHSGGRR